MKNLSLTLLFLLNLLPNITTPQVVTTELSTQPNTGQTIKQRVMQLFIKQHGQIVYTVGYMNNINANNPYCSYPGVIKSTSNSDNTRNIIAIRNMFLVSIISVTDLVWNEEYGEYVGILHTQFNHIAKTDYAGGPTERCKNYCYNHSFRRAFEYRMSKTGALYGDWATHSNAIDTENFRKSPCLVGNWSDHCLVLDTLLQMSAVQGTWYDIETGDSYTISGDTFITHNFECNAQPLAIKKAQFQCQCNTNPVRYKIYSILKGEGILIQVYSSCDNSISGELYLLRNKPDRDQ